MKSMVLILMLSTLLVSVEKQFYKAFQGDSSTEIEEALDMIAKDGNSNRNDAYRGALLTKKASYAKSPVKKLNIFKDGSRILDQAIERDKDNAEYRFLRLVIQEKAPALLGYNKNKEADKKIIETNFNELSNTLQAYIKSYAKESSVLSKSDL